MLRLPNPRSSSGLQFKPIDVESPNGLNEFGRALENDGIAFYGPIQERSRLVEISKTIGKIRFHRDSDEDGVTRIAATTKGDDHGLVGFTRRGLDLHTDQSNVDEPSRILFMWMEQAAAQGGESIFVDGLQIMEHMEMFQPRLLQQLQEPESVGFRGSVTPQWQPVFSTTKRGQIQVRFRSDSLGYFSRPIFDAILEFENHLARFAQRVSLPSGYGVAIDNHRWLHGRSEFIGTRILLRLLVDKPT